MHRTTTCLICRRHVSLVTIATLLLLLGNSDCQQSEDTYQRVLVSSNNTNGTPTPDIIIVTVHLLAKNISLTLQRNPNVPSNVTVIVGQNGSLDRYVSPSSQNFAHYIDPSNDASVLIKAEKDADGKVFHTYTGAFLVGDETYTIKPASSSRRRRRRRGLRRLRRRDTDDQEGLHIVQKDQTNLGKAAESLTLPTQLLQPLLSERIDPPNGSGGNNVDKPAVTNFVVEVLVVVESRLYQRMYELSSESSDQAKAADTTERVTQYYGHIINGADMRYRNMQDSTFTINVRLAGVYIAKDANSSTFIEDNRAGSGASAYVKAEKALSDFADWVNERKQSLPSFDQASLYTSDFLNGITGDRISGLAFLRAICTYWSVLICRESGEYGTAQTTAHELGHNLGAGHDGIDNTCSSADQHIMVSSSGALSDATYKNAFSFSTCSVSEIKNFITTLPANNCLTKTTSNDLGLSSIPPGVLYSPDFQCAMMYGNRSFYCGGQTEDRQICRSMGCYHPSWQYCVTPYEQRAFSGTQCGNKKWCYMGDCVSNDKAAPLLNNASDECMYGDSKAPFYDSFKCSNVSAQPWKCYEASIANGCCRSCSEVRNETLPGCEYGNRYRQCDDYLILNCNETNIRNSCCKTCLDRQYQACNGDQVSDCSKSDCTTLPRYYDCCQTCASFPVPSTTSSTTPSIAIPLSSSTTSLPSTITRTTTSISTKPTTTMMMPSTTTTTTMRVTTLDPSCKDLNGLWCRNKSNFPRAYCYTIYSAYCCAFCASIRNDSQPGCEYGDRYTWCDLNSTRCTNPTDLQNCCAKCRVTTSSTTTTTTTTTSTTTTTPTTKTIRTTSITPSTITTKTTTKASTTTLPTTTTTTATTTTATTTMPTPTTKIPLIASFPVRRTTRAAVDDVNCNDLPDSCSTIEARQCYSSSMRKDCCKTCSNLTRGPPGCEYGDRLYTICMRIVNFADCRTYKEDCCHTCRDYGDSNVTSVYDFSYKRSPSTSSGPVQP